MGERIKDPEFQDCLKRNKIREFPQGPELAAKELLTAKKDYGEARDSARQKKFKWAIIQSYYAMFHAARSLLYIKKYREKSHYCLIRAVRALYVETGKLSVDLIEGMQKAKTLRENADYYDDWTAVAAGELLTSAEAFLDAAGKILGIK